MGKISFGFAFASLLLTASADVYDASTGYVTLIKDNITGTLTAFNSDVDKDGNKIWSDEAAPHPGTNYYVAAGKTFATPTTPGEALTWQGGKLVSAGKIWLVANKDITFPDLVLQGCKCNFYTAGSPGPLCGQVTVQGATPVVFWHNTSSDMRLNAKMIGASDSVFRFDQSESVAKVTVGGDWRDFQGTLILARSSKGRGEKDPVASASTNGFHLATTLFPGLLKVESDTRLTLDADVTVGSLEIDGGVELDFGRRASSKAAMRCLTVTGDVTLNGKLKVLIDTIDADVATGYAHPLFKFKADQDVSIDDFEIVGGEIVNPLGQYQLAWEVGDSASDGYKELRIVKTPPVGKLVRNKSDASAGKGLSAFTDAQDSNGKYYWDDQAIPQEGNTYVVSNKNLYVKGPTYKLPYEFPGAALYLVDTTFTSAGSATEAAGILADELYWYGGTVQVWGEGAKDTALDPSINWFTIGGGRLFTYAGTTIKNTSFNSNGVKFDSELVGGGTIEMNVNNAGKASGRTSYNALTGLNTNFTGRILVTAYSEPVVCSDDLVAPSDECCVSLMVTNGLSLGGACPSFTYDALTLNRYGRLWISKRDVGLADGLNRGVYVNGIGRMEVADGLTLSVAWPVTVNGTFRKQGAGTLALGGTMRFTNGDEATAPVEGKNLVRIEEGVLRLDAAHALDGAAVTFVEGTKLVLKESTTDDELAAKGLVNVKEGDFVAARVASEATDGAIAVDIDASGCATAESATFGLFTVPTEAEATALKAKVRAPRRVAVGDKNLSLSGALAVAQNADGTWTVSAKYEVHGLLLLVR